jgi:gamma-glutamylcyclotransferase (GGCT)/AIG2-like uncharacterized protein YtfP
MPKLPPKHIAAYGTLREGNYNYDRYKRIADASNNTFNKVGEAIIEGYELWDLGPYPYSIKTGNPEDKMTVDIIECDDYTIRSITRMEEGAGYTTEEITINGIECLIYTYPEIISNTKQIKNGDYNNKN